MPLFSGAKFLTPCLEMLDRLASWQRTWRAAFVNALPINLPIASNIRLSLVNTTS
jgi:hypothetical protein